MRDLTYESNLDEFVITIMRDLLKERVQKRIINLEKFLGQDEWQKKAKNTKFKLKSTYKCTKTCEKRNEKFRTE